MMIKELLAAEYLDINFQYPAEYKNFLKKREQLDSTPWWLIGTTEGFFQSCFDVINTDYKSKKLLIPFAKSDEMNLLACFDTSHRIWFHDCEKNDITNADWDNRYSMPDFSAWLERVLKDDL